MKSSARIKKPLSSFTKILSAIKKLSREEKQVLYLQLFSTDALKKMKEFESKLKKKKKPVVIKTDEEIVLLTTSIRRKNMTALRH